MKSGVATSTILSGLLAYHTLASPTKQAAVTAREESGSDGGLTQTPLSSAQGFLLPSLLKTHDIDSNANTVSTRTATARNSSGETSTLYWITAPHSLLGKKCGLVFHCAMDGGGAGGGLGNDVAGEQAIDIFFSQIADLGSQSSGNLRDVQLARMRFRPDGSGLYGFDEAVQTGWPAFMKTFPCPGGCEGTFESVAVGQTDLNSCAQDFGGGGGGGGGGAADGSGASGSVPNGFSIAYWA